MTLLCSLLIGGSQLPSRQSPSFLTWQTRSSCSNFLFPHTAYTLGLRNIERRFRYFCFCSIFSCSVTLHLRIFGLSRKLLLTLQKPVQAPPSPGILPFASHPLWVRRSTSGSQRTMGSITAFVCITIYMPAAVTELWTSWGQELFYVHFCISFYRELPDSSQVFDKCLLNYLINQRWKFRLISWIPVLFPLPCGIFASTNLGRFLR